MGAYEENPLSALLIYDYVLSSYNGYNSSENGPDPDFRNGMRADSSSMIALSMGTP
jgi:hypothetical protein